MSRSVTASLAIATMAAALLATPAPATAAAARPACPLLAVDTLSTLLGKKITVTRKAPEDAAHYTACRYAVDAGSRDDVNLEVYWQFAKMTYDGYCKTSDATPVKGLGEAACMTHDTINVLKGETVLRVRMILTPIGQAQGKAVEIAKVVLPKL